MDFTLHSTTVVALSPGEVFDVITDIERLPDWNREIAKVTASPGLLAVGSEWVVTMHAMKTTWASRSRVLEIDRDSGVFAYRSQSDDGNPSFADWRWQLQPDSAGGGTHVTVEVDVHPRTFLRRWLFSELRRSGLRKAMNRSLAALGELSPVR
jgi:uncharacterized protein YndB with AHSA1/START domain